MTLNDSHTTQGCFSPHSRPLLDVYNQNWEVGSPERPNRPYPERPGNKWGLEERPPATSSNSLNYSRSRSAESPARGRFIEDLLAAGER